jgi:RNA polymerase sigma factor for flagellar operon FliA
MTPTAPVARDAAATDRDSLIRQHLPLVRYIARRLQRRLSTEADFDELVSAGTLGLLGAADHFDPARGLRFSTFAAPRIQGAMLDELRRLDRATRVQRRKARALEHTRERLAQRTHGVPTTREVAAALGVDVGTVHAWDVDVERFHAVPLDATADDDAGPGAPLEPACTMDVEDRVTREQVMARVRAAIAELPTRERQALALTYLEGLPLQSVARLLGVTESRVSQLRTRALGLLRARLAPLAAAVA